MKNIVIGVTGGIACYKAVEIVNDLTKKGHNVEVIMTKNAQEFVTPLTFQSLSHNKVITDMYDKIDKNLFVQIHKSYLVNTNCIAEKNVDSLTLNNGEELPIGRKYSVLLKK